MEVLLDLPIPICKPLLPPAESILPYLRRLDGSRIYSNFGPLVREFEARFAQLCSIEDLRLVTAANGTLAIQAALIARCNPVTQSRNLCLLPAFTFAATVSAVISAGLVPMFVDVDASTCVIDLDRLQDEEILRRTAAVLTVASFGHLPDLVQCNAFEARTGIPVIVDAAGCSDALLSGAVSSLEGTTLALSFHATKAFGIGEGGAVATSDASLAHDIRTITNFGFDADRVARLPGINAKMSEYTAAVGLALLDQWPEFRARYHSVLASYRKHFGAISNTGQFWLEPNWITTYPHVITASEAARDRLMRTLKEAQIDSRRWWMDGCHNMPAYGNVARLSLPNTERWVATLVGLPLSVDLDDETVGYIASQTLPLLSDTVEAGGDRILGRAVL
jgi:dTDP-4-amino-4,6-dideoxygalactose transaminase